MLMPRLLNVPHVPHVRGHVHQTFPYDSVVSLSGNGNQKLNPYIPYIPYIPSISYLLSLLVFIFWMPAFRIKFSSATSRGSTIPLRD